MMKTDILRNLGYAFPLKFGPQQRISGHFDQLTFADPITFRPSQNHEFANTSSPSQAGSTTWSSSSQRRRRRKISLRIKQSGKKWRHELLHTLLRRCSPANPRPGLAAPSTPVLLAGERAPEA
jgi:hypothetical protein